MKSFLSQPLTVVEIHMISLKYPENGAEICLATQNQLDFYKADRKSVIGDRIDWRNIKKSSKSDDTFPLSVKFVWEAERIATLLVSESEDFSESVSVRGDKTAEATNLKCGQLYFWKVRCGGEESEVFSFKTSDILPRWIKIDGLTNVRDCGGWNTSFGKIRQGLIYRGSELNSHIKITPSGLKEMERLGIKSVVDLRGDSELIKNVYNKNYVNIPAKAYGDYIEDYETNRRLFEFLSQEENYPVYIHCRGGADRTGTAVFLLNALLGAEISDLIDDYEATTLSIWEIRSRNTPLFLSLISALDRFEGTDIRQKYESYLKFCGITEKQIENIRRIML